MAVKCMYLSPIYPQLAPGKFRLLVTLEKLRNKTLIHGEMDTEVSHGLQTLSSYALSAGIIQVLNDYNKLVKQIVFRNRGSVRYSFQIRISTSN
jgi:hypothetical protein